MLNNYYSSSSENYDPVYEMISEYKELNVRATYPYYQELNKDGLPKWKYETKLEIIDMDKECDDDIARGTGFYIRKKQTIKKDIKSDDGIVSRRFGLSLDDVNTYGDNYRCKCGMTTMKANNGLMCEHCHTRVKYVSTDFSTTGWIKINEPYFTIHPNLYKKLVSFIGKKNIDDMLDAKIKLDENGHEIPHESPKTNPFGKIGMIDFRNRFDEIMEFYRNKNKSNANKIAFYEDIMANKDKIFTHSIPVYTLHLRPISIQKNRFNFEGNNANYNLIAALANKLNNATTSSRGHKKPSNELMYDILIRYMEIYADLEKQISQKKGYVRSLNGGRYNFTARNVITPLSSLAADEIILPYTTLIEILSHTIINILTKTYTPSQAYRKWDEARINFDQSIYDLIKSIIESEYIGILLNRNPSISPASILQMHVVGVSKNSYAAKIPLEILSSLAADFDGDTLNIMLIINKQFLLHASRLFNPRLAMQISTNDGMFNSAMQLQTDSMICLNSFAQLGIDSYSKEELEMIRACQAA